MTYSKKIKIEVLKKGLQFKIKTQTERGSRFGTPFRFQDQGYTGGHTFCSPTIEFSLSSYNFPQIPLYFNYRNSLYVRGIERYKDGIILTAPSRLWLSHMLQTVDEYNEIFTNPINAAADILNKPE